MRYKQRGASYFGIFFAIVVVAFAAKLAVALVPPFWDDRVINQEITAALSSLPKTATQRQFKDDMSRRFSMNSINSLKIDDIVEVNSTSNGLSVQKKYEVREPFFSNVELVMTFEKDFDQYLVQSGQ